MRKGVAVDGAVRVSTKRRVGRQIRTGLATLATAGIALFGLVPTMAHAADAGIHLPDDTLRECVNDAIEQAADADITLHRPYDRITDLSALGSYAVIDNVDVCAAIDQYPLKDEGLIAHHPN